MKYSEVTKLIKSYDENYLTKIDSKYFYVRYKTSAITFAEVAQVEIEHPYILNTRIKFTEFPRYEDVWKALSLLASTDIKDRLEDPFYHEDNLNEKYFSGSLFTKELYEQDEWDDLQELSKSLAPLVLLYEKEVLFGRDDDLVKGD